MTRFAQTTTALLMLIAAGCAKKAPLPDLPPGSLPEPPADSVENVVFWIGDAGAAIWSQSPVLHRLAADIDQWSRITARDSAVAVVYLGDNVYPGGLRGPPERPEYWADSTHLEAQVDVMRAPATRQFSAFALFMPGNHDWGHKYGAEGEARLAAMEQFLARRRARGINVELVPKAGSPGPAVVDIGRNTRIIIIDTAWWLLSPNDAEKRQLLARVEQAMASAGRRGVILAAHHPYRSAGPHGGLEPFWKTLGIKWLLTRSGAALQDLNSLPYRDLLDRLKAVFERTGPPLLFAGGHDHVLQVIKATEELDPRFMLVSGAGSKLSRVGHTEGMIFRSAEPGYMRMVVKKNGGIDLFVITMPESFLKCDRGDPALDAQCVTAGAAAFRTSYGVSLR
ncbi:MAG TPA: hypothetical protein VFZ04_12205 [Longimicrobiales bacterium]